MCERQKHQEGLKAIVTQRQGHLIIYCKMTDYSTALTVSVVPVRKMKSWFCYSTEILILETEAGQGNTTTDGTQTHKWEGNSQ